jgi:Uma2 family endonuclease
MPALQEAAEDYYTYADVLQWDEDFRAELVDGAVYLMAPPLRKHQGAVAQLFFQIQRFLLGKPCKAYPAPFAVRLFPRRDNSDDTVLEPDLVVVCDPAKLDDRGCNGPPDFVAEVLSPAAARYDRILKFRKYQEAGVREYWIVDPDMKTVQACVLENGRYVVAMYEETDTAPVAALPGCEIGLRLIFGE